MRTPERFLGADQYESNLDNRIVIQKENRTGMYAMIDLPRLGAELERAAKDHRRQKLGQERQ